VIKGIRASHRNRLCCLLGFLLLMTGSLGMAAPPSANWLTLETETFRFHVTEENEDWAAAIASRAEALADEVNELVAYTPTGRIDVLVVDPFNQANGMALPIIGKSRMILFTTAPQSDSVIGHYGQWDELLFIHEQGHLAHLARASRGIRGGPWRRLWLPLGIGPLATQPMWVIEGYATWLEGELTGQGRPNSDLRDALIRQWAREGRLPSYGALSRPGGDDWMARTMAYLVGSAYFEWLEARTDKTAFQDLWARSTARANRDFSEAFEGVFGDSPEMLYARFVAETVQETLNREEEFAEVLQEGRLWQDYRGSTGNPAVSPDGEKVAVVRRHPKRASVLDILKLDDNESRFERWQEEQEKLIERDPDDVPAVRPESLSRDAVHRLPAPGGGDIQHPRWIPGEEAILFHRFTRDAQGMQAADLYRWDYASGDLTRVTRASGVRRADPSPDGQQAVAVRQRHGQSQLVMVDLLSGEIEPLTEARLDKVHDYPRFHPEGERIAYMRHEQGRWQLMERRLKDGETKVLVDSGGQDFLSQPSWSDDGRVLYFSRGERGQLDLYRLDGKSEEITRISDSPRTALAPEPLPDEQGLLYLSHGSRGIQIRKFDDQPQGENLGRHPFHPLATPRATSVSRSANSVKRQSYGAGPQFASALIGARWHRSDRSLDLGIRGGDPVGRLDWLAAATRASRGSVEGEVAGLGWHGWPLALNAAWFNLDEDLGAQSDLPRAIRDAWPTQSQSGLRLGTAYDHHMGLHRWRLDGAWVSSDGERGQQDLDREWWELGAGLDLSWRRGDWQLHSNLNGRLWRGESELGIEQGDWDRDQAQLSFGGGFRDSRLTLDWRASRLEQQGAELESLRLGGQAGTVANRKTQPFTLYEPAIAAGLLQGHEYERQGVRFKGEGNAILFYRRHRMGWDSPSEGEWLNVTGIEVSSSMAPRMMALPEIKGLQMNLGLGRVYGEEWESHRRFWLNLHYVW